MKNSRLALAALLLVGGCATVEISAPASLKGIDVKGAGGKADRAIVVSNEGYFLFQSLPIVSGDMDWDARNRGIVGGVSFFERETSADKMISAMAHYANSLDCDLTDVVINDRTECEIGLFGIQDWFKTLVGFSGITYSGVLRPRR